MEFEGDKPISEADRSLAKSRLVTIQPLHSDISPEDLPSEAVAAAHLSSEMIGNVIGDIEQDAPRMQPTVATVASLSHISQKGRALRNTLTVVGIALLAAIILFTVLQK